MTSSTSSETVVVSMGCAVLALRAEDGSIAWHVPTLAPVVRMYPVGQRLFAVAGTKVVCIDTSTGTAVGELEIGFVPDAGMICGEDLVLLRGGTVLGGADAMICLTASGGVKWRGTVQLESTGLLSGHSLLRTFGPSGEPRSEARFPFSGGPAGVAFGDAVVQPDLQGHR